MTTPYHTFNVLALDVDGVLTDGTISFLQDDSSELKSFHVHDGQGIAVWHHAGHSVVIISGRKSDAVTRRAHELNIKHVYQDSKNKLEDLQIALSEIGSTMQETIYIGDDLGDLQIMNEVGYAIAVQNAVEDVQQAAHWITPSNGGHGAVRDAIEHVLRNAGTWESAVNEIKSEITVQ